MNVFYIYILFCCRVTLEEAAKLIIFCFISFLNIKIEDEKKKIDKIAAISRRPTWPTILINYMYIFIRNRK